ncbi:MAG: GAF domain-containing protein [Anaerolineae bacterium]
MRLWILTYTVYLFSLEILCRQAKRLYDTTLFRLFRIHFYLAMIAILALVAPPIASGYLWFFFSMPMLAALGYFGRLLPLLIIYLEVCAAMLVLTFAQGWPEPLDFATMAAKGAILGLLAAVLYFFVHLFPRLREESTLLKAATTLIQVLDQRELCQLLADVAKAGVPASDGAVVHLLRGEDNRTLVPMGSSHLDLTTLGRSLMRIGAGIAGHAIQDRKTINVPDVSKDDRYHPLPSYFIPFSSLLVAPMYVGDKNVGTISVHSTKKEAFGEKDKSFITMLAAQGATAIANAELYNTRTRRRQQISDILEASRTFGLHQPLDTLFKTIATAVCRCSGYRMAVVNLLDKANDKIVVKAMAGVPPTGRRKLAGMRIPLHTVMSLLQDEFRVSESYFIRHDRCPKIPDLRQYTFTADPGERKPGEWHQEDMLIVPIQTQEEELLGYISVDDPGDRQLPSLDTVQALEVLASVAATAIQNARLYEDQQRRSALLGLINQVGRQVTAVLDLDTVLSKATESICQMFGYDRAAVFMMDETGEALVLHAICGIYDKIVREYRQAVNCGIIGWVAQNGQTLLANNVSEEPRFVRLLPAPVEDRIQSELAVPIRVGDITIGVLDLQSVKLNAFDDLDVEAMKSMADQLAVAVENARIYQEAQRHANELSALRRASLRVTSTLDLDQVLVTVLEEVRGLLNVVASTLWLIDPKTDELVCHQATGPNGEIVRGWRLALGQGIAGWVACHGKSLIVPDTRADERHFKGFDQLLGWELRSILTVPLRVKQDVIGVLQVVDTEVDRFKPTDLTLVEPLAASAAIAIENARLYKETDSLRAFNENIVQSMEEGILLEDASEHIAFVNHRTAELLGYAPEELIGQHWAVTAAPEEMGKIKEEAAKRPKGVASRYETVLLTKEDQRVPVIVSATPLSNEGSFTGVLAVFTDITDRKRQETRLRDCLSTITSSLAQHTSLEGLYEFIVEAGAGFLSARDCALFLVGGENGDELKLVAAGASPLGGDGSSAIGTAINIGPPGGLVGYVAETCQPIRLPGEQIFQHPSWSKELWTELRWDFEPGANHSLLAAPMCLPDGRLAGILVARDATSREGFSEFDELLLETLATNAAADIEWVRSVEKAREDAVRDERARLETDLHEAMNVLATGVRWESEILSDQLSRDDPEARRTTLKRLQAALARAYADLRYLLEDLRDPTLEQEGLLVALRKRAEIIGGGCISMHGELDERLPPEIEGILYRVGQEAMSNAVKHSGVAHNPDVEIELHLECSEKQVKLWVKDNGKGFDVESTLGLSHKWGLRRLRDTLREMGGNLDIDSAAGQGATICATIGLMRRSDAQ